MSFLSRVFRGPAGAPAATATGNTTGIQGQTGTPVTQAAARRELLRIVLRDTLIKHGIPTAWVGCDMLVSSGGGRNPGMHLRLLLKHWDPRLLTHGVALQDSLQQRAALFDPEAVDWLTGISWQFALPDPGVCPAMPDPAIWTSAPEPAGAAAPSTAQADRVAELKRQFADADALRAAAAPENGFEPTQAMFTPTEPARF